MESLYQILNLISTALLIPTIIILILMFVKVLFHIGSFFGIYADRTRFRKKVQPALKEIENGNSQIEFKPQKRHIWGKYLGQMLEIDWEEIKAEKKLTEIQLEYKKQLEPIKILMRSGPMLGLMGTLIPMGPALAGLASGDISSMALNMQLAFSTTVLGIFIGLSAFILHEIQKRWANEDYSELEYLYELIQHNSKEKQNQ